MVKVALVSSLPAKIGGGNVYEKEVRNLLVGCAPSQWLFFDISKTQRGYTARKSAIGGGAEASPSLTFKDRLHLISAREKNLQTLVDLLGLDLVIFLSPVFAMSDKLSVPTIGTVWDFGVFDLTAMPEFSGEYASRMRDVVSEATHRNRKILVPTRKFGNQLSDRFGVSPEKAVPTGLPLPSRSINSSLVLPAETPYFTYPAKFWKHKNHATLFQAFSSREIQNRKLRLVLTGISDEDRPAVLRETSYFGISKQVSVLGYLSYPAVQNIISKSAAVLMPSLLGPVNYPPLEALSFGTSVVQSDAHDFDSELPENVTTVPATDPSAWVDAILRHQDVRPTGSFFIDDQDYRAAIKDMFLSLPF